MDFRLSLGDWQQQRVGARAVRLQVFVIEQNIPLELEWDEMDALSLHAVAYDQAGQPIGTGRLLPDGHIGRMAVSKALRGQGVGGAILTALMQQARARGEREIVLHAQTPVEAFYQRFGFSRFGEEFSEAGIPHVRMRCGLL